MSLPHANPAQSPPLLVTSLEHSIWLGLHAELETSLNRLGLAHLSAPSMLILHDFIDCAVRTMHRKVFLQLAETDFGMIADDNKESLEELYQAEVSEHGSQNIARYCKEKGWHVAVSFPLEAGIIVSINSPARWDWTSCSTTKLVGALGYQCQESLSDDSAGGSVTTLRRGVERQPSAQLGCLLDEAASLNSVQCIYEKLGYGLIQFSSAGEILALSRSMLTRMKLPINEASITAFCAAIPFNFYNDIIWGLALTGQNGEFENYRIRMHISGKTTLPILFNISGYRDSQSVIHSLWQVVTQGEDAAGRAEGSLLNEARIHNITRKYVPQLVAEKAKEAIQLGKDKLINEECSVAVLFCDIVGFTSYVEGNANSESIINTLNTILRKVSSSVKRHNGSIDKFMGDCVMAIFRDPADAIFAALDMQSHSADINALRSRAGQDVLRLRIGIHWGEVVIGDVGTPERMDWTAIGDVVNTASRIEKNCSPGSILISQKMRDAVISSHHPDIMFGEIFQIMVKGKREALPVCHIKHPDDNTSLK